MRLYLLRHATAEEGLGKSDPERNLVADGKKKLREVLKVARAAEVNPSLILSSPYNRAVQTAQIAAEELGYEGEILQTNAFIPSADPAGAWEEIRIRKGEAEVLVASHEPLMSTFAAFVLNAPSLRVEFKKSGLMAVDLFAFGPTPHGVLAWYLTPKITR